MSWKRNNCNQQTEANTNSSHLPFSKIVMTKSFFFLLTCLELFVVQAWATTYYVDVNRGNDQYPGTETEPLRTIRRAGELMEAGDKALIREGIYHETIMCGKSGLPEKPIVYEGVDRDRVILRGSVTVRDWKKIGSVWFKVGLKPVTSHNAFVMVDEKRLLKRVSDPRGMPEGSFCLDSNDVYYVRLWGDGDPNTKQVVDVYELNLGFNAGTRWGGTAKKHIILRNLTFEKYASFGVSTAPDQHEQNSHWELDNLKLQYNNQAGVFACLDDWYVHDCQFLRNRVLGCQINGARVRFLDNTCKENEYFGPAGYGGVGMIIGPDESAHSCIVSNNVFERDGAPDGYGCGIYLEGRSHDNIIRDNLIVAETHAGIGFYGGSYNQVFNNVLVNISPSNSWELCAAFVVEHSREGPPTQSVGNVIAHNTVWGCVTPVAVSEPNKTIQPGEMNRFVNNLFCLCRLMAKTPRSNAADFQNNGWYQCPEQGLSTKETLTSWARNMAKGIGAEGFMKLDTSPKVVYDPMLRDPSGGDFRLKPGSPLIDAGVEFKAVTIDREGNSRPLGSAPDIGAYEYVPR